VQVTRPRRLHTILSLPLCLSLYRSATTYAYLLWLYLAHTSDHHSHRSLHNRPPFAIEYLSLHPSYLLLVSLPHTSSHFSISLPPLRRYLATQLPYLQRHHMLSLSPFSLSAFHLIPIGCTTIYLSWHLLIHLFILHLIGSQLSYYLSLIVPKVPLVPTGR